MAFRLDRREIKLVAGFPFALSLGLARVLGVQNGYYSVTCHYSVTLSLFVAIVPLLLWLSRSRPFHIARNRGRWLGVGGRSLLRTRCLS